MSLFTKWRKLTGLERQRIHEVFVRGGSDEIYAYLRPLNWTDDEIAQYVHECRLALKEKLPL